MKKNNQLVFNSQHFNSLQQLLTNRYPLQVEKLEAKLNQINEELTKELLVIPNENLSQFQNNSDFIKMLWKFINRESALEEYSSNIYNEMRNERKKVLDILKDSNAPAVILLSFFLANLPIFYFKDLSDFYFYIKDYSKTCPYASPCSLNKTNKLLKQLDAVYQYFNFLKKFLYLDLDCESSATCLYVLNLSDDAFVILESVNLNKRPFDSYFNKFIKKDPNNDRIKIDDFRVVTIESDLSSKENPYFVTRRFLSFDTYKQIDEYSNPSWLRKKLYYILVTASHFAHDFRALIDKINRVYKFTENEKDELVDIYYQLVLNPTDIVVTKRDTLKKQELKSSLNAKLVDVKIFEAIKKEGGADLDIVSEFKQVVEKSGEKKSDYWLIHGITLLAVSGACGVGIDTGFENDNTNGSVTIFTILANYCLNKFIEGKEKECVANKELAFLCRNELDTLKTVVREFTFKMTECRQIMVYFFIHGKPAGEDVSGSHDILKHEFKTRGIPFLYGEAQKIYMQTFYNHQQNDSFLKNNSSQSSSTSSSASSSSFKNLTLPLAVANHKAKKSGLGSSRSYSGQNNF